MDICHLPSNRNISGSQNESSSLDGPSSGPFSTTERHSGQGNSRTIARFRGTTESTSEHTQRSGHSPGVAFGKTSFQQVYAAESQTRTLYSRIAQDKSYMSNVRLSTHVGQVSVQKSHMLSTYTKNSSRQVRVHMEVLSQCATPALVFVWFSFSIWARLGRRRKTTASTSAQCCCRPVLKL